MSADDGSYGVEYPGQLCERIFPGEMCVVLSGTGFFFHENKVFPAAIYSEDPKSEIGAVRGRDRNYCGLFTRRDQISLRAFGIRVLSRRERVFY